MVLAHEGKKVEEAEASSTWRRVLGEVPPPGDHTSAPTSRTNRIKHRQENGEIRGVHDSVNIEISGA